MKKKLLSAALALLLLLGAPSLPASDILDSASITADAADLYSGNKITARTQQQIIDYINAHPFYNDYVGNYLTDTYAVTPVYSGGTFVQGSLSSNSLTYGLNSLNVCRYVAGLGEVTLDATYNDYAQAGALCDAAIGQITHTPAQAAGMPDDLYNKGYTNGTKKSNLGVGYTSIPRAVMSGWMEDADSSNISKVGHRRWCLSPKMGKTGFGHAGSYTAMYAQDGSAGDYYGTGYTVAWPAPNTPVELFKSSRGPVWSVSKSSGFTLNTVVTLKRLSDNKVWTLKSGGTDGDFYINNDGYGQPGCVIFRPSGISSYSDGDKFSVSIVDDSDYSLSYTVNFFSLPAGTGVIPGTHTHSWGSPTYTWSADGKTCTASRTCTKDPSHVETEKASVTSKVKTAATCAVKGTTTYTATFTSSVYSKQTKDVQDIPVNSSAHSWGTPTYTWSADGKTCTAKRVCATDSTHIETEKGAITSKVKTAATCAVKGTTTYTATFTNSAFSKQTKDVQDIPVNDSAHIWGTPSYTWSADGKTCTAKRVCATDPTHIETEKAAITSKVKTAATCTVKGTTTYTATFTNSAFSKQTKDVQDIPLADHNWGDPMYVWTEMSADEMICTAKRICKTNDSHVDIQSGTVTVKVTKMPTCTEKGSAIYTAKFNSSAYTTQTKDAELPATGHHWKSQASQYSSDNKIAALKFVCADDPGHVIVINDIRVSGPTRFETAAGIADQVIARGEKVDTVLLVNSEKFADALAGVPLAVQKNAVILLSEKNSLPESTAAEIKKLGVKDIIILGGNSAIGKETVEKKLIGEGFSVKRIEGITRYETAVNIAEQVNNEPQSVFVVYSKKFPDALSVSSIAAQMKAPILYADREGALDEYTKAYLNRHKNSIKNLYIIGGYSSVSYDVQTQLQNTLGISAARIYGTTRYETCLSVLKYKDFAKYVSGGTVCLTTGEKFPDALAGGVLAALTSSPMLLAKSPWEKAQTSYLHNYKRPEFALPSNYLYTLGGKNSVSETARFAACSFLSPDVSVSS